MTALPVIQMYKAAAALISKSGLAQICAPFTGGMGTIFTLHRIKPSGGPTDGTGFQPNYHLAVTPEFLDRVLSRVKESGFEIISLTETVKRLKSGVSERPFCTFTFDDGYLDNIEYALPIFRKHDAPMTVFVCTDLIDGTAILWWEILEAVLVKHDSVEFEIDSEIRHFETVDIAGKAEAARVISNQFRTSPNETAARAQFLRFAEKYGVDPGAICRAIGADWSALKKAAKDPLFHVGGHTVSHPILSRLSPEDVRQEIEQGRSRLQSELDIFVEHFAYPYGDEAACGRREFDIVAEMGFKSAVTTRPGVLMPSHGQAPWALPRASLNGHYQNDAMVDSLASGVPFFVANGFRRIPAVA